MRESRATFAESLAWAGDDQMEYFQTHHDTQLTLPTLTMTGGSVAVCMEPSHLTDDGRDLRQFGLNDWIERQSYDSTCAYSYFSSFEVTFTPMYEKMAPLSPFVQWAQYWEDFENHRGTIIPYEDDDEQDMKDVPFKPDSIPKILRKQRAIWKEVIKEIDRMFRRRWEWDTDIDMVPALESLLIFRNLLQAPSGLEIDHFNNVESTVFPRLGPCAVLEEVRAAIVGSKVCAYYQYQPFDKLQVLLAKYKRILRKTDANPSRQRDPNRRKNTGRYDASIEEQGVALMKAVDDQYAAAEALWEDLDAIPEDEGDKWDEKIKDLHKQMFEANKKLKTAKEKAHWHFQMVHYIKARVEETDVDCLSTPMQYWEASKGGRRSDSPQLILPEKWQKRPDVSGTMDAVIPSLQNTEGFQHREPQLLLQLRDGESSFIEGEDSDDDSASVCSIATVRPKSGFSETPQAESSSHVESSRAGSHRQVPLSNQNAGRVHPRPKKTFPISLVTRTFPIDWMLPVDVSDTESEDGSKIGSEIGSEIGSGSESESESEGENGSESESESEAENKLHT